MRMQLLAAAGIAAAFLSGSPAKAEVYYPWCAVYGWTTSNCGFVSQRQCLATISGVGGFCRPNPQRPPARMRKQRSDLPPQSAPAGYVPARVGEPARMIQLPGGRWVSTYGCVIDDGFGRFVDCSQANDM